MDKYQDGNRKKVRKYYEDVLSCIKQSNSNAECLDIGSGIGFTFEELIKHRFHDFQIDCIDLIPPEEVRIPEYVRSYRQISAERKFDLHKKYDYVFCFEVIEHIDCTDVLLTNCYHHLKEGGVLFIAHPNLAGIYARIELLLGYQPHILEVSNRYANLGSGMFGKLNNPTNTSIHHIRGITYRAMRELLQVNHFRVLKTFGSGAGGGIEVYS